jgi:hypothetical protein
VGLHARRLRTEPEYTASLTASLEVRGRAIASTPLLIFVFTAQNRRGVCARKTAVIAGRYSATTHENRTASSPICTGSTSGVTSPKRN